MHAAGGGAAGSSCGLSTVALFKQIGEHGEGSCLVLKSASAQGWSPLLASGKAPGSSRTVSPPAEEAAADTELGGISCSPPAPFLAGTDLVTFAAGFPASQTDLNAPADGRVVL